MLGDATLFTREDEVEEQWKLVDAIVGAWGRDRPTFPDYAAGSWGPARADELLHRDGRSWRRHWEALMGVVTDIERKLARQRCRQEADGDPELRTSTMTHVVWCPPRWLPRAKRVLAGLAERHPARTIFLVPVPGRSSGVEADRRRAGLRDRRRSRGAVRGDRGAPPRRRRPASGLDRAAAPDLRPARLLPLAGRARLGREGARRDRRRLRPARRRLVGVARAPAGPTPSSRGSSSAWPSRTSPGGATLRVAGRAGRALAGDQAGSSGCAVEGPRADALLLAGWLRSRLRSATSPSRAATPRR